MDFLPGRRGMRSKAFWKCQPCTVKPMWAANWNPKPTDEHCLSLQWGGAWGRVSQPWPLSQWDCIYIGKGDIWPSTAVHIRLWAGGSVCSWACSLVLTDPIRFNSFPHYNSSTPLSHLNLSFPRLTNRKELKGVLILSNLFVFVGCFFF